ncbi:uncharacterized protein LOC115509900 [Lynx canadensis]|uniref:uncharacterized protein LOC115509900 n=1 Tax=Lynx canadensis TaxID=61383 RepID=UPI0013C4E841|nr:uncharacterized protein LOC115509900 [Lynx canadensis]
MAQRERLVVGAGNLPKYCSLPPRKSRADAARQADRHHVNQSLRREPGPAHTWVSARGYECGTSGFQICEKIDLRSATQSVALCYGSHGTLVLSAPGERRLMPPSRWWWVEVWAKETSPSAAAPHGPGATSPLATWGLGGACSLHLTPRTCSAPLVTGAHGPGRRAMRLGSQPPRTPWAVLSARGRLASVASHFVSPPAHSAAGVAPETFRDLPRVMSFRKDRTGRNPRSHAAGVPPVGGSALRTADSALREPRGRAYAGLKWPHKSAIVVLRGVARQSVSCTSHRETLCRGIWRLVRAQRLPPAPSLALGCQGTGQLLGTPAWAASGETAPGGRSGTENTRPRVHSQP